MTVKKAFPSMALALVLFGATACSDQETKSQDADITVSAPWTRETVGGAKNGAIYFEITNNSRRDNKLVDVRSDLAKRTEVHNHIQQDNAMVMIHVTVVDLPAGESVSFRNRGLHVMLSALEKPFVAGETVSLTLDFELGEDITLEIPVLSSAEAMERMF